MHGKRPIPRKAYELKRWTEIPELLGSVSATACILLILFTFIHASTAEAEEYDPQTVERIRASAQGGSASSQVHLGWMYENGKGVTRDYGEALKWYRKSADAGNAHGQSNLGMMYQNGHGVPQDYGEALKWYRKSAAQGNSLGQAKLGVMYGAGWGVPKDYGEALKWLRLAAKQGQPGAIKALNRLGEPISIDPTVLIHEVKTDPKMVLPGTVFKLIATYSVSDPGTKTKRVPMEFLYAIEKNGKTLMTLNPKIVQSDNGLKMSHKETLTASRQKGTYTIRVTMKYKEKSSDKTADFEIK